MGNMMPDRGGGLVEEIGRGVKKAVRASPDVRGCVRYTWTRTKGIIKRSFSGIRTKTDLEFTLLGV